MPSLPRSPRRRGSRCRRWHSSGPPRRWHLWPVDCTYSAATTGCRPPASPPLMASCARRITLAHLLHAASLVAVSQMAIAITARLKTLRRAPACAERRRRRSNQWPPAGAKHGRAAEPVQGPLGGAGPPGDDAWLLPDDRGKTAGVCARDAESLGGLATMQSVFATCWLVCVCALSRHVCMRTCAQVGVCVCGCVCVCDRSTTVRAASWTPVLRVSAPLSRGRRCCRCRRGVRWPPGPRWYCNVGSQGRVAGSRRRRPGGGVRWPRPCLSPGFYTACPHKLESFKSSKLQDVWTYFPFYVFENRL